MRACSALHTHKHTAPPHTLSAFSLAHVTILPTCACVFSLTHKHTAIPEHMYVQPCTHVSTLCPKHTLHAWAALPRTSTRHPLELPLQPLSPYHKTSLCKARAPEAPPRRPQPCQHGGFPERFLCSWAGASPPTSDANTVQREAQGLWLIHSAPLHPHNPHGPRPPAGQG